MDRFGDVVPAETVTLLRDSLLRLQQNSGGSLAMTIVGGALALWTTTGAMTALMRALNRAYDRGETRGFVRQRLVALVMMACVALAFALVFGLLVLGPAVTGWLEGLAGDWVRWVWWIAQWPVLLVGLLVSFATVLFLGPDVHHPRWRFVSPGAVLAIVLWLVASGAFAFYVSQFGSYNKAWGSLAAVIVMLTWLWVSALALLFGAEVNAEAERSRELRRGEPAEAALTAPPRG
jgi:membrane protein